MPTGGGSRRSGRGDVVIVGTCFSHISSLPRASYKFISTRRPPAVARVVDGRPRDPDLAPMRLVNSVFSTPGVRDDRLNLWSGLLARSQNSLRPVLAPQGLARPQRITFVQIRGLQVLRCTGSSKLPTHRLQLLLLAGTAQQCSLHAVASALRAASLQPCGPTSPRSVSFRLRRGRNPTGYQNRRVRATTHVSAWPRHQQTSRRWRGGRLRQTAPPRRRLFVREREGRIERHHRVIICCPRGHVVG